MDIIGFVTLAVSPYWVNQTLLLAESLRAHGGKLAQADLFVLTPQGTNPLPPDTVEQLKSLNAELLTFELEEQALHFPLGLLPFAAAEAELIALGNYEQLAWVLPDTLVISPPDSFILPPEKQLGYRPVHHANIGSDYESPPDAFWAAVLKHCKVPEERIFPMKTCTRDKTLRPYINAGFLVTRPETRLMHAWMNAFQSAYQHPNFLPLLTNQRNAIFLHQAILSGVMMQLFPTQDLLQLPEAINYPLHLHDEYPEECRPASLGELTTARYETVVALLSALGYLPVDPSLSSWLEEQISKLTAA